MMSQIARLSVWAGDGPDGWHNDAVAPGETTNGAHRSNNRTLLTVFSYEYSLPLPPILWNYYYNQGNVADPQFAR